MNDKLGKDTIAPFMDKIASKFANFIHVGTDVSIDESTCTTLGRLAYKMSNLHRPNKVSTFFDWKEHFKIIKLTIS